MMHSDSEKSFTKNLLIGAGGALFAGSLAATLWAYITVLSGWQIGYLAIGTGFCVAIGARLTGQGTGWGFQVMSAAIAVLACFIGNLLAQIGFYAEEQSVHWLNAMAQFTPAELFGYTLTEMGPIDLLFYALAAGAGFKYSMPAEGDSELPAVLEKLPPLPLSLTGYTLLLGFLAALYIGYRVPVSYYHENGERSSTGFYKKGHRTGEWKYFNTSGQLVQTGVQEQSVSVGQWVWLREDSSVEKNMQYAYGIEHGLASFFYPSGQLQDSGSYYYGRMHGRWVGYYENGTKRAEGKYHLGNREGLWVFYYANGQLEAKAQYVDGDFEGAFESYYENGSAALRLKFVDNKPKILAAFDSNGTVLVENGAGYYRDVQPDWLEMGEGQVAESETVGKWSLKYPSGWRATGNYEADLFLVDQLTRGNEFLVKAGKGTFKTFDEDGTLVEEGGIAAGRRHGTWRSFYSDGKTELIRKYKNGKLEGIYAQLSVTGDTTYRSFFVNGKAEGEVIWTYENGITETIANYANDQKNGLQLFYDDWGNLIKEETHSNDKLVEIRLPYAPRSKAKADIPPKAL